MYDALVLSATPDAQGLIPVLLLEVALRTRARPLATVTVRRTARRRNGNVDAVAGPVVVRVAGHVAGPVVGRVAGRATDQGEGTGDGCAACAISQGGQVIQLRRTRIEPGRGLAYFMHESPLYRGR